MPPMNMQKRTSGDQPNTSKLGVGPYVARVVSHLDPRRSGDLRVELLTTTGSGQDGFFEPGQLFTVRYCMPFYGVNDVNSNGKQPGYQYTQQSYGFWAVPPDPGTKVLVIFAEGQSNQGYWIGCIQDEYMNRMVPQGQVTEKPEYINQEDPALISDWKGKPLPVGEYNKKLTNNLQDPGMSIAHHNPLFAQALSTQGLIDDIHRGQSTASARRDIPSTVFGWNTPGPLDKRDGAPRGPYGPKGQSINQFRSRLGGSSFVMDDGDAEIYRGGPPGSTPSTYYDIGLVPDNDDKVNKTLPYGDSVRLRTRTGHQILLHNSEDLIYIANSRGSAWIELTSNGKIDIYADDSINIRTNTDMNIVADRDINIKAGRDINTTAGRNYKLNVYEDKDVRVGKDYKTFVGSDQDVWVANDRTIAVGNDEDKQVAGTQRNTITGDYNLQVGADGHIAINANMHSKVVGDYRQTVNGAFNLNTVGDNKLTSGANTQIKSASANKLDAGTITSILSVGTHSETASQVHMNSTVPATAADSADSIGDTFTKSATNQAVDDSDQILDKDGNPIADLKVTADAARADRAVAADTPRRVPEREPWGGHENLNPTAHTSGKTASIVAPPPALRKQTTLIDQESDQGQYNESSGIARAGSPTYVDAQGNTVEQPYTVIPGKDTDNTFGNQPAHPVPQTDQQRFFLSELIKKIGLDPATALNSASDPVAPGNAQALGMAMAQVQAECKFEPRSENMNYSASRMRAVWPSRFKGAAGVRYSQELEQAGPPAIANSVYGNRMGNGPDEGWKYRGRGLIQITGKDNYKRYGGKAGVDIINNPDMANDPVVATKVACAYIDSKSISWTSPDFATLGNEFRKAVGYANQGGAETNKRIKLGRGFYQQMINGELTPLASLTTVEPMGTGTTTVVETAGAQGNAQ